MQFSLLLALWAKGSRAMLIGLALSACTGSSNSSGSPGAPSGGGASSGTDNGGEGNARDAGEATGGNGVGDGAGSVGNGVGAGAGSPADDATTTNDLSDAADAMVVEASGPAACTPAMTGSRGLTMQTATVDGGLRTYLMYLPSSLDPSTPAPVLFVFHGSTMTGQQMHDITGFSDLAEREGFAVVFPDGQGAPIYLAPWNVEDPGQTVCGAGQLISAPGDDFAFMDAMKAMIGTYQCIDTPHIFVTGFSMGGYFSHHVGCYRGDVRAIAPHSGGTTAALSDCTTGHVPAIIFHGTMDGTIAPGCDDPNSPAQSGFPPSATLWSEKNGCAATYTTVAETSDAGGAGQCYLYDGCPVDGQVELCTFTGMAHCWAGGSTAGQGALSACPTYPGASELAWAFFKTYAW
jgi:polyhydroxybutyrate depolymerase